jgi:serine/threonine protein kinase
MPQATTSANDFNFITLIGKGNSAEVKLAENKLSKKLYAIKILQKQRLVENDEIKVATIEQRILNVSTKENHPFIVKLYGAFQTQTELCLVMEYVPGGDLMWQLQKAPFAPDRAQYVLISLALKIF